MYGAGRGVIRGLLEGTGCEIHEIRNEMNPGFGGVHPEPIGQYLNALSGAICMGKGSLGLATDGDADRIGAMDERGVFVDPHKIISLSLRYLAEKRKQSGSVVRTVSTTRMVDLLAARYGLEVHETPVGFNHIADYMLKEKVLIGGEESGGISFLGHIPEGDGIIMGLLLTEIVAESGTTLSELVSDLLCRSRSGGLRAPRSAPQSPGCQRENGGIPDRYAPKEIGGVKVDQVSTKDGVKYILDDNSWLLIRPSGTEPVLRVYAEGRTDEMLQALLAYGESVATNVV
jgi:phosphomannomutase